MVEGLWRWLSVTVKAFIEHYSSENVEFVSPRDYHDVDGENARSRKKKQETARGKNRNQNSEDQIEKHNIS